MSGPGLMREGLIGPVRGLPGPLPDGERLLWQGSPRWAGLARHAFHVRTVAVYCATLLALRGVAQLTAGHSWLETVIAVLWCVPLALAAVGILTLMAWLYARTTVFTITSRRVVMHYGIALPVTLNIPFGRIGSAALKTHADSTGDLALALTGKDRIAFVHLWPFGRAWRVARTQPLLRAVRDPVGVADVLAQALRETLPVTPSRAAQPSVGASEDAAPGIDGRQRQAAAA